MVLLRMGYVMDGDFVPANALEKWRRKRTKYLRSSKLDLRSPEFGQKAEYIPGEYSAYRSSVAYYLCVAEI